MHFRLQPDFLNSERGRVFNLHVAPVQQHASRMCVVIAPALEEEMNRCRYMCTMLAQQLAERGIGTLMTDPYGTGDSAGLFRDTDWQQYVQDLKLTCDYAVEQGYESIVLLGIRMGALHALEVAPQCAKVSAVHLWQPVVNGKTALTQLLRIRIAAALGRDEEGGSVKEFEAMSERGDIVEVSGYEISPALFSGIQQAKLDALMPDVDVPLSWFTAIASEERKPPRVEQSTIEKWQKQDKSIDYNVIVGPPYWQVHERTLAPALVEKTVAVIEEMLNAG